MALDICNRFIRWIVSILLVPLLFAGCATSGTKEISRNGEPKGKLTLADLDRIQIQVRRLSDSFGARISQACFEMEQQSTDPVAKRRARQLRVGQLSAALSSAVGRQPLINLLDLAGQVTLARKVAEAFDVPTFGEPARPLLEAAQETEPEVWAAVSSVISTQQTDELRKTIDGWYNSHPTKRQGAFVKFSEFAEYSVKTRSNSSKSSLLGLLYLDPLASLDPVAAEVRESRELIERTSYFLERFPLVLQAQLDSSTANALESNSVLSFVRACNEFATASQQLSKTLAAYPEQLSQERDSALKQAAQLVQAEREGAVRQIDEKLTAQQKALFDGLQGQQDKITAGLDKTDQVVDKLRSGVGELRSGVGDLRAGVGELRSVGKETVSTTADATTRLINHVFRLALVAIAAIFLAALLLIIAAKRIPRKVT